MKNNAKAFLVALVCSLSFSVFAEEVLHADSDMEIVRINNGQLLASDCFNGAQNIKLSVYKDDSSCGYSSVSLNWEALDHRTNTYIAYTRDLLVYSHYCSSENVGTVVARLPKITDPNDPKFGERFSVVLTDYTRYDTSKDIAFRWVAKVRSGNGWCGSSDARMTIQGNPKIYDFLPLEY